MVDSKSPVLSSDDMSECDLERCIVGRIEAVREMRRGRESTSPLVSGVEMVDLTETADVPAPPGSRQEARLSGRAGS